MTPSADAGWWRHAVVYQVYIRSFADADGDGLGDIGGIRSRLGYLGDLGVDAIWITPWYRSPMVDGGYDVADYRGIDPRFGTLDDARALIQDAHTRGIRVIIDIIPNHTSSEHPWFREALAAPRGSAARERYLFRDGRGSGGIEPPNNWPSAFGAGAWTPAPDDGVTPRQWYLHLFDASQPDLNWDNAEVRAEFESILDFWLDFGVDGFRIDVAFFLAKAPGLPDLPGTSGIDPAGALRPDPHPYSDLDGVHEIYRGWRRVLERHGGDAVFCGEINLPADRIARYLRPDELHTAFNFDFALRPWDAAEFRASIDATLASHSAVGAPATWVIGNHDLPRPVFRYGRGAGGQPATGQPWNAWVRSAESDQSHGLVRARAAALLYLALPGSAYLYQGDELGLPEVLDLPPEARQDPTFLGTAGAEPGRDGCRVPIPWSGVVSPFGFGPPGTQPWLPQPSTWNDLSVTAETGDAASTLELYRAAFRLRRQIPGFAGDQFEWLDGPRGALWFGRGGGLQCMVNLSSDPVPLPAGRKPLLSSLPDTGDLLPPDCAAWFIVPTTGVRREVRRSTRRHRAGPADRWLSGFVEANGISVHWTRTGGAGPPVVLAHGFSDDGLCWSPIATALESEYDLVMLDARGHGVSEAPEHGYGPAVMGEDLARAIAALGLDRPAVIGHSMGAVAAIVAAGTHPNLVRALIVEDPPSGLLAPPAGWVIRPGDMERRRKEIERQARESRAALVARARAENPRWSDAELLPWAESKRRLRPAAAAVLTPAGRGSMDMPTILRSIACPVLVIGADPALGSALTAHGQALLADLVPHARFERVAGAGHSVRRDAPDEYLRLVRDFLAAFP